MAGLSDEISLPKNPQHKCSIQVTSHTTIQEAMERYEELPSERICILDMANAHRVGGGYQFKRGTQEEMEMTQTGALGILTNLAEISPESGRATFLPNTHLPHGAVGYLKTKILWKNHPKCAVLIVAFADFRKPHGDFPESEFPDYASEGKLLIDDAYKKRIRLEIYNLLKVAILKGETGLILGASGCGAFMHDSEAEAEAWKEALEYYDGYFHEITFAIKGGNSAFSRVFN